jgi:hypothetical protein
MGIGYVMLGVGILGDGRFSLSDLRVLGMSTIMCSLLWFFVSRTRRVEDDVYEAGRKAGYADGYINGRRVARPVIVRLPRGSSSEFGEDLRVGGLTE